METLLDGTGQPVSAIFTGVRHGNAVYGVGLRSTADKPICLPDNADGATNMPRQVVDELSVYQQLLSSGRTGLIATQVHCAFVSLTYISSA